MTDVPSLRAIWRDGRTALGAWIFLRDATMVEAAALAGFDYVCIDMQHGLADFHTTVNMLQAIARTPAVPVVRVQSNDPAVIGRALDAGALGIIVPMVNNEEEARRAVAACRYAPDGIRSIGPTAPVARYGTSYILGANELVACIPMIETRQAVDAVDAIAAVPGIDALYVGPADLSLTLGLPPSVDSSNEEFNQALEAVLRACRRHGVVPGIHSNAATAPKRHEAGFRLITCSADQAAAMEGLAFHIRSTRQAIETSGTEVRQC
jgi:4-hydroxy-2-oxoheptanedioate aldolase